MPSRNNEHGPHRTLTKVVHTRKLKMLFDEERSIAHHSFSDHTDRLVHKDTSINFLVLI